METCLWILEKKSVAQTVCAVLGEPEFPWENKGLTHNRAGNHLFAWLDGHAFEQAMPDHYLPDDVPKTASGKKVWRKSDLPIIPPEWVLIPKEAKKRRLDKIAELLQVCDVVYHVGDAGEEGQLLVDEALLFFANRKPVKRVLINDPNQSKVRLAIENARSNDDPLFRGWYQWALARSHYDWLFGLNCTRAMTLRGRELGFDGLLPVGSVLTPLLYIVRERDRSIEDFKPMPYFTLHARLEHPKGSFKADWKASENQAGLDESGRLINAQIAQELCGRLSGKQGVITSFLKVKKEEKAPLTLSMNELQIEGFTRFGYTGQQVLDAAQALYDEYKVATYPRTANRYLSLAQHKEASRVVDAIFLIRKDLRDLASLIDVSRKSNAFDDKKMDGQEHHGIIPTAPECPVDMSVWSEIERNVFDIIVRSYLAQFALPFEFIDTTLVANVDGEAFTTSGKTPVSFGWKKIIADIGDVDNVESNDNGDQTLPVMSEGDHVLCASCEPVSRKTSPPKRFDDKLLLEAMMNVYRFVDDEKARKRLKDGDGIGTTATRAGIIQDLKDRELLVPIKAGSKKLMTSNAARTLIDALPIHVKDPAQAGVFKAALDRIATGEMSYETFIENTVKFVTRVVQDASNLSMKLPVAPGVVLCPACKSGILRRKDNEKGAFWFCSNWNREGDVCSSRFQDVKGKPLMTVIDCPQCKSGHLRLKVGTKGAFWFCSNWNAKTCCDARFDNSASGRPDFSPKPKCPICKQGELRSLSGTKGKFWGCSRFNEGCKASFDDKAGKPNLAPKPVYKCPKCKTGQLHAMSGANGKFWGCSRFKEGCKGTFPDKTGKPDLFAKAS